jgi:hypothetical protein
LVESKRRCVEVRKKNVVRFLLGRKGISTLVMVIAIAVVLIAVIAGAYLALSSGGGSGGNGDGDGNGVPDGGNNGDGTSVDVTEANSLQFSVTVTPSGQASEGYTYMIKDAGTSSLKIRVEWDSSSGDDFIYIINGEEQKVWVYSNDEWMEYSDFFQTYWDTWNSAWEGYRDSLVDWTGTGDWSYTTPNGDSVRVHDINVNPSLSDSLFQH